MSSPRLAHVDVANKPNRNISGKVKGTSKKVVPPPPTPSEFGGWQSTFPLFTDEELSSPVQLIAKLLVLGILFPLFITKVIVDLLVVLASRFTQQVPALADWVYINIVCRGFQLFIRVSTSLAIMSYNVITQVITTTFHWFHQAARWYVNFCASLAQQTWQFARDLLRNHIWPGLCHYVPIFWGYLVAPAVWVWTQIKVNIVQPILDWLNGNVINPTYKTVSDTYHLHRDHTIPETYEGVREFAINLFYAAREVPVLLFPPSKGATAAGGEGSEEPEVVPSGEK